MSRLCLHSAAKSHPYIYFDCKVTKHNSHIQIKSAYTNKFVQAQRNRIKIVHYSATPIPETRMPFLKRGRPRPRSVCHKPYDDTVLVETTRPASLSALPKSATIYSTGNIHFMQSRYLHIPITEKRRRKDVERT